MNGHVKKIVGLFPYDDKSIKIDYCIVNDQFIDVAFFYFKMPVS